jgi:hypothetical protein
MRRESGAAIYDLCETIARYLIAGAAFSRGNALSFDLAQSRLSAR